MTDEGPDDAVLKNAGAYFLSVVEASQDCIRVISADGRVEYMNAMGLVLLEIDDFARNRHQYWPLLWPPESRPAVEQALRQAMAGQASQFRAICPTAKGSLRWWDTVVSPIFDEARRVTRILATSRDVTSQVESEAHRQLLVNELNHRVKNTLAIIQSIASQSLRNAGVDPVVRSAFEGRLMAIASTHNVLTDQKWSAASLRQIVDAAVTPYCTTPTQLVVCGDDLAVSPKPAVMMALAFHELAINALKYGALSTSDGQVEIRWGFDADARLNIQWTETGGPRVASPSRRGFGSRVIEMALATELQGQVKIDYRPEGLRCAIQAPRAALDKVDAFMPLDRA